MKNVSIPSRKSNQWNIELFHSSKKKSILQFHLTPWNCLFPFDWNRGRVLSENIRGLAAKLPFNRTIPQIYNPFSSNTIPYPFQYNSSTISLLHPNKQPLLA
jgi:hypothetical protein